jgi:sec-independent protein translocase protein TatC
VSYPDAPYNEDPPEERIDPSEKPMGFFDHLDELRGTLMKCAVVYVVFAIAIGIYVKRFNDTLMWPYYFVQKWYPLLQLEKLQATEVTEGLSVMMQLCLLGALGPSAPFILFFLGQFVAPALTKKEKRLVLPACFAAFVLFVVGAVFSYFVLVPSTLVFSIELNELFGWDTRWKPGSYYSLLSWLVIGVGCAFEFPLVIVILVWLGLLEVPTLRKYRRHAVVVIIVIAAAITPTTDPFSLSLFAAPLYVLYEIAILVSSRIVKRKGLPPSL